MFEGLMKDEKSPRNKAKLSLEKVQSNKAVIIPELKELEREIKDKRPNNVVHILLSRMKFIKNWATARCKDTVHGKAKFSSESEGQKSDENNERGQTTFRKNIPRKAVLVRPETEEDQKIREALKKSDKSQQIKSRMMIQLANMPILAPLSPEEIWELVQKSQVKSYYDKAVILDKGVPIKLLHIIIAGEVSRSRGDNKPMQYFEGDSFGEQALFFQRPSEDQYRSIGPSSIATIWGSEICEMVQAANRRRYQLVVKAISSIHYLQGIFPDQLQKLANIALNQPELAISEGDDCLNQAQYKKSFFVVMAGQFGEYNRRLDNTARGDAVRIYESGQALGFQPLVSRDKETLMRSHGSGIVVELKVAEIEKSIGPIHKIVRRKQSHR